MVSLSASSGCGARPAGRARLSAFHRGSCQGALAPFAQLQARLPGTRRERMILKTRPTRGGDPALLNGCYPRPPVPVQGKHARMMPGAARERSVSFRARAPLSLRFREYPRPKASPRIERDSQFVAKIVTIVKCVPDTGTLKFTFRAVATVAPKCRSNWLIGQHSHSSSTGSVLQCIHSWWLHC